MADWMRLDNADFSRSAPEKLEQRLSGIRHPV